MSKVEQKGVQPVQTPNKNSNQQLQQAKEAQYNSDQIPPDWSKAKEHYQARRVGDDDIKKEDLLKLGEGAKVQVCDCCGYQVQRKVLGMWEDTSNLDFLGSGYPLFFSFIKVCAIILFVMICSSSAYALYHNSQGTDCKTFDYIKNNIVCKRASAGPGPGNMLQVNPGPNFQVDYKTKLGKKLSLPSFLMNIQNQAQQQNYQYVTEVEDQQFEQQPACTAAYVLRQAKVKKVCVKSFYTQLSLGNQKSQDVEVQSGLNLLTIILIIGVIFRFRFEQRRIDFEADKSNDSPSDFAVCVKHIPHSIKQGVDYDDSLKKFLIENAIPNEKAKVLKVILAFDLKEFNDLNLAKTRHIQRKQALLLLKQNPKSLMNRFKKWRKVLPQDDQVETELKNVQKLIDETEQKLETLQRDMADGKSSNFSGTAFAYCLNEQEKSKIISANQLEKKHRFQQAFLNKQYSETHKGLVMTIEKDGQKETRKLHCEEAAEPTDVFWENLAVSTRTKFFVRIVLQLLNFFFLIVAAFGIYTLTMRQQNMVEDYEGETDQQKALEKKKQLTIFGGLIAVCVNIINFVLASLVQKLALSQNFTTRTKYFISVASTSAIMQFANTAIVSFLIQALKFKDFWSATGLVNAQSKILFMNMIVPSLKGFIYPPYIIGALKRRSAEKQGANSVLTQAEAQLIFQNPEFQIQQEYAGILKTMLMTAMYAPIIPIGPVFSLFAIFLAYWYNKYNLLRRSQVSYQLGRDLSFEMTEMLEYVLIIFSFSSAYWIQATGQTIPITTYIGIALAVLNSLLPIQELNEKVFKIEENTTTLSYYQAYKKFDTDYERSNPALSEHAVKAHNTLMEVDTNGEEQQVIAVLQKRYPLPTLK